MNLLPLRIAVELSNERPINVGEISTVMREVDGEAGKRRGKEEAIAISGFFLSQV
jgi:hypothetical protein